MKIFLTGATGYIGYPLALKLAETGNIVHALVRNPQSPRIPQHPNIKIFPGDINDRPSISKAIKGCEQAYHVAGFSRLWAKEKKSFYEVNVTGTQHVLKEAFEQGVKKLVYTSSCSVFGPSYKEPTSEKDPRVISFSSDYDLSKYICECLVKEYAHRGLFAVIVNPSRVYGPGLNSKSNPITSMIMRCLKKQYVFVPSCKSVLGNYAFIEDVVCGHIAAMQSGISAERYILGGENLSYHEVFSILHKEIKYAKLFMISPFIMKIFGGIQLIKTLLTGMEPAYTPAMVDRITNNTAYNCQKAIRQLGYHITPFTEGIHQTIENLKKNNYA